MMGMVRIFYFTLVGRLDCWNSINESPGKFRYYEFCLLLCSAQDHLETTLGCDCFYCINFNLIDEK
jgi:hypothetical protein